MEIMWQLARTSPLKDMAVALHPSRRALSSREGIAEVMPYLCGSGYHPVGTVPMSASSIDEGAVDARGRVRGVEGLYVADASIMPTIPSANTHLPTLMIGERFGAWLSRPD
jgi:choline dehydrogenase